MISSFFGKTKPITHIVLAVLLFLVYFSHIFLAQGEHPFEGELPLELMSFGILLLSIFIINLTVRTEKVTDSNSYAALFFVLLTMAFPEHLTHKNAILANFFVMLALWRLLSIKSIRSVKHKIFDATILICIASLFYDWALALMLLILMVINIYDRKTFKNWLVPLLGVATVFVISFTLLKVNGSLDFFREHYLFSTGTLRAASLEEILSIKALVYILLVLLITLLLYLRLRRVGSGRVLQLRIFLLAFLLGVGITLFTHENAHPLMITFFPASVLMANYFEGIKKPRLRGLILALGILLSLSLFAIELRG